jgi:hypothetical protein
VDGTASVVTWSSADALSHTLSLTQTVRKVPAVYQTCAIADVYSASTASPYLEVLYKGGSLVLWEFTSSGTNEHVLKSSLSLGEEFSQKIVVLNGTASFYVNGGLALSVSVPSDSYYFATGSSSQYSSLEAADDSSRVWLYSVTTTHDPATVIDITSEVLTAIPTRLPTAAPTSSTSTASSLTTSTSTTSSRSFSAGIFAVVIVAIAPGLLYYWHVRNKKKKEANIKLNNIDIYTLDVLAAAEADSGMRADRGTMNGGFLDYQGRGGSGTGVNGNDGSGGSGAGRLTPSSSVPCAEEEGGIDSLDQFGKLFEDDEGTGTEMYVSGGGGGDGDGRHEMALTNHQSGHSSAAGGLNSAASNKNQIRSQAVNMDIASLIVIHGQAAQDVFEEEEGDEIPAHKEEVVGPSV